MGNAILLGTAEPIPPTVVADGKYVRIVELESGRKTLVFEVQSKAGHELGYISFYAKWRKYTFVPAESSVFDQVCLREIANFLEDETKKWRAGLNG